jgi:hypothetical protein
MSAAPQLADSVATAIGELEAEYEDVDWEPDGAGGVYVTATPVRLGDRWEPALAPVTFHVAYNYPYGEIYPFYTVPALARTDGGEWPSALQHVSWRDGQVVQISLRTRNWNPAHDTASTALAMVGHWFRTTA